MGRDVTGLRVNNKPGATNVKSKGTANGAVHVSPKALPEKDETKEHEQEDHVSKDAHADELSKKQEGQGVKSSEHEPEEKIIRAEAHKSNETKLSSPVAGSSVNTATNTNSFEPMTPGTEAAKQNPSTDDANQHEINDSGVKASELNDHQSPKSVKKSQPNSPSMPTKQLQSSERKYYDDEDNWSLASSGTSVRTSRSRVTVPVAPRFTCVDRLQRRKEFYTKLEEKHKALEKERLEYEARTREEEQAAIKQLRKSMVVKANPVPSFYREGPPPKVELKKLPVTRAKSPNLSRRKSCGDAVKTSPDDKAPRARATRHSVGVYKEGKSSPITPKPKDRVGVRKSSESGKVRVKPQEPKQKTENPHVPEQGSTDNAVVQS